MVIQSDQKVSVHLTITVQSSVAQILFDHPVQRLDICSTELVLFPVWEGVFAYFCSSCRMKYIVIKVTEMSNFAF